MDKAEKTVSFTEKNINLSCLTDTELIDVFRGGNEKALNLLIRRYSKAVSILSAGYHAESLTKEDWFQEGMLGLIAAVHTFRKGSGTQFATFSAVCIKNRLNTAWKKANNKKNAPLNDAVFFDESSLPMVASPEDDYIKNEELVSFEERISSLFSKTEKEVIFCYLADFSYAKIAERTGLSIKSVDNALCRAKKKLQLFFRP